ncbi:MAG: mechanosensitive ion channel family protein [Rhodoferax sp.]|nr:mechanosensitive ion channel family protein [Rhodoferax sp.]HMQ71209.1 mechanosensitive ion channel family protein [Rubrivivax sp.]
MLETLQSFWDSSRGLQGPAGTAIRIVGILVVAWIVLRIVDRALKALKARMAAHIDDAEAAKRALTLGRIFHYIATVVVSLIAVILVLSELGISIAPILGAAGVVGLAVGFGAQSLVKDFFTGFVLLLENQIRQGDVVEIAGRTGVVEKITLRFVQLRDYGGIVYFVPNGEITTVVNMSRGFAHAVIDAGIGYGADVDQVMALMREVADEMRRDPAWTPRIEGEFELAGVESWGDSAVTVRGRIRTRPGDQWAVRRELLRRLKYAFDKAGVEIPFPQRTVHVVGGKTDAGTAAVAGS